MTQGWKVALAEAITKNNGTTGGTAVMVPKDVGLEAIKGTDLVEGFSVV